MPIAPSVLMLALGALVAVPSAAAVRAPVGTCGQFELEPNDTAATASPIDLPGAASGVFTGSGGAIGVPGDVDWFSFTAPPGARLWLAVDTGVAAADPRDSVVSIFGADGLTLVEEDDDDGTGNGRDPIIESLEASLVADRVLTAGGTYYARVQAKVPGETIDAYSLLIAVTSAPPQAEIEPNDAPPGQQVPVFSPILGSLSSVNDVDWYNVTVLDFGFPFVVVDGDPERDGTGTDITLRFDAQSPPLGPIVTDSSDAGSAANPPGEGFAIEALGFARVTGMGPGTYMLGVWYSAACDVPVELQAFEVE